MPFYEGTDSADFLVLLQLFDMKLRDLQESTQQNWQIEANSHLVSAAYTEKFHNIKKVTQINTFKNSSSSVGGKSRIKQREEKEN